MNLCIYVAMVVFSSFMTGNVNSFFTKQKYLLFSDVERDKFQMLDAPFNHLPMSMTYNSLMIFIAAV